MPRPWSGNGAGGAGFETGRAIGGINAANCGDGSEGDCARRPIHAGGPGAWTTARLNAGTRWTVTLDAARRDLMGAVRAARRPADTAGETPCRLLRDPVHRPCRRDRKHDPQQQDRAMRQNASSACRAANSNGTCTRYRLNEIRPRKTNAAGATGIAARQAAAPPGSAETTRRRRRTGCRSSTAANRR